MVLYKCTRCNKEFNKISHYKRHINRKYKCIEKPLINSVMNSVPLIEQCNNNRHVCNFCNRSYSRKPNLNKHLKTCKVKIEKELKKNTYDFLLNKINNLSIIIENQSKIINDLQEKTKGNIKIYDVKDIKMNRSEIVDLKYKT
jgi:hypothetical protein